MKCRWQYKFRYYWRKLICFSLFAPNTFPVLIQTDMVKKSALSATLGLTKPENPI